MPCAATRPLLAGTAGLLAALALVASGCGSGGEAGGAPEPVPASPADRRGAVAEIREALREPGVQTLGYRVVAQRDHDTEDFTQGLELVGRVLYEGTGLYGESTIERRAHPSGRVTAARRLPARDFGEGLTVLGRRVYQLTWREERAYVYDARTLRGLGTRSYRGEGWGLAAIGRRLVMSDGSAVLRFRDPATFDVERSVVVRDGSERIGRLNELEYVGGAVLANVWQTDRIAIVEPRTGRLEGWIDLADLRPAETRGSSDDVLNGIAYDRRTDRLLVTGKRWPTLFEITTTPEPAAGAR